MLASRRRDCDERRTNRTGLEEEGLVDAFFSPPESLVELALGPVADATMFTAPCVHASGDAFNIHRRFV